MFVGNFVYSGTQWAIVALITKLGTPAMVGQYVLAMAIGAPVFMLLNMQLRAVQVTDAESQYKLQDYLSLRVLTSIAALATVLFLAWRAGYDSVTVAVIVALTIAKFVESLSDLLYGFFQKNERMDWISVSLMLRGVLGTLALAGLLLLTSQLSLAAFGLAASWTFVLIVYDTRKCIVASSKEPALPLNFHNSLRLARLAVPLGVVMLLISLNVNIPRYFIERYSGVDELGYFGAIGYIAVASSTFVYALGQASSARLAVYGVKDRPNFIKLMSRLLLMTLLLGACSLIVAVLWGQQILSLVYNPAYSAYSSAFVWIMVGAAFEYSASMFLYGITALRAFSVQVGGYVFIVLLKLVLCYLWVPALGLIGAAYASAAVGATQFVLWLVVLLWVLWRPGAAGLHRSNNSPIAS